jgi:hypothetical protein
MRLISMVVNTRCWKLSNGSDWMEDIYLISVAGAKRTPIKTSNNISDF